MSTDKVPQSKYAREAATAAQWWTDQMFAPQPSLAEQMGAEPDSPMSSPMGAIMGVLAQAEQRVTDPNGGEAFKAALARRIETALERYPSLSFGVDYGPDPILADAAREAGLSLGMTSLPWKTNMWVDAGRVRVSKGYGAASVAVPLVAA